jgi:hypothetical protein
MRPLLVAFVAALAVAAATASSAGAQNECRGIQQCIPVGGPWVYVHGSTETQFLMSCGSKGVVGGLDALATSTAVRITFDGRLGAPVGPGTTTSRSVLFRARLAKPGRGASSRGSGASRTTAAAAGRPSPHGSRPARRSTCAGASSSCRPVR